VQSAFDTKNLKHTFAAPARDSFEKSDKLSPFNSFGVESGSNLHEGVGSGGDSKPRSDLELEHMITQARTRGQKRVMEFVKNFAKSAEKTVDDAPRINLNAFECDAEHNPAKPNPTIGLEGLPKDGLDKFNSGSNSSRINNLFRQANNFSLSDDPSPNELMHMPNDTPF